MSEDRLRELLSTLPAPEEIATRAERARRRALAATGRPRRARLRWAWAAVTALLVALVAGGGWWQQGRRAAPAPTPPAASGLHQDRLEFRLVLSDGTRVQWILDENFSL